MTPTRDDPVLSELTGALFASRAMGLCLFDADGMVERVEGAATSWAPQVGRRIDEAPVFVGMLDALFDIRSSGAALSLPGIGLADGEIVDIDILWLPAAGRFAALSKSARERARDQAAASQAVRDHRLLEEKIRLQQAKIAEQAEMMSLFVRHVPAAVAMLDEQQKIVMASERWKEEHGDPSRATPQTPTASPLTWPRVAERLRMELDIGVPTSRVEKSPLPGRPAWKKIAQAPWRRADHAIGGSILFCEDATDAMRKAESLRARVDDLHKLAAEMDSLGRAVSNDLRAPFQQIDFFSKFLLDADQPRLDPVSRDYIVQIRAGATRIDGMMAALRHYMLLSETDPALAPFDIAAAISSAVADLRPGLEAAGVRIHLRDTLSMEGDLRLISGLFRRLIDNSAKYSGAGSTIVIDCFEEDDGLLARVADDGPGIAPHLRRRAFDFFERLNAPAAIPGFGMGLAECRKIADLHGGAVAIDPDFDAGLRVLISLPRRSARAPSPRAT